MVCLKTKSNILVLPTREWNPMHIAGSTFIISSTPLIGEYQEFEKELRELCIKYGHLSEGKDFEIL